ncbi:NADH-cytochrome b5 reductase-like [Lutzomyia longipalpis]|uniref:NADH-cytochrome b5 reductase-like n=1 Tax=Lutzomyia longipalpis TaxID=7200 RepID=UPI0024837034|nr:NADH-cytochrome b5 reductase-like [Lutzomyia longipalpis]
MDDVKECCGSGCNNCVLDRKFTKPFVSSADNFKNIFNGNYEKFSVESIERVATGVYCICFVYKGGQEGEESPWKLVLNIPPGWYLQLRCNANFIERQTNSAFRDFSSYDDPKDFIAQLESQERNDKDTSKDLISRPYTPIKLNEKNLSFNILFKLEKFGKMSQIVTKFNPGDVVEFKGPYGELVYTPNTFRHIYLFSHGVAIAPLFSFASSVVRDESDETFLHIVACYRNINEILLRDEMKDLQQFWNCNASIFLAHETTNIADHVKIGESIVKGKLGVKDIEEIVKFKDKTSYFLICGTEKFSGLICSCLRNLAIDNDRIFVFK